MKGKTHDELFKQFTDLARYSGTLYTKDGESSLYSIYFSCEMIYASDTAILLKEYKKAHYEVDGMFYNSQEHYEACTRND